MEYERTTEAWPPYDYQKELEQRFRRLSNLRRAIAQDPTYLVGAKQFYRKNHHAWIRHWGVTYEPRKGDADTPAVLPYVPFQRQRDLTSFIYACIAARQSGLIEKSRDMGATWDLVQVSVHLWLFSDGSIGWGSRKAQLVDKIGDPDSIFEKIRVQLRHVPAEFMPEGFTWSEHVNLMRIINPESGATITGEGGDEIGRGGRKTIYITDEAAHLEHPESIEASLNSNTDVRIDISSVGAPGNVFHRKREAGVEYDPRVGIVAGKTNVFVMDWRQHPGKTQAWYDAGKAKHEDEGLLHVWAREVDRDYAASIQGTIIPGAWARAAIDAHIKLGFEGTGGWSAALDIADEGGDRNALVLRRGVIVYDVQEWGERDTGRTARRAVAACEPYLPLFLQYDAVGVGSGVKAEQNRLRDEKLMPKGLRFIPWNGGATPLWPDRRVIPDDKDTPFNKDFYKNLKAQGWWQLRRRFELTHKAVRLVDAGVKVLRDEVHTPQHYARVGAEHLKEDVFEWDEADLISLPSTLPLVWKLVKELSQPVMVRDSRLKMLIDKQPEGTMSPNLADALMMNCWPANASGFIISDATLERAKVPITKEAQRKVHEAVLPAKKESVLPPPKQQEVPPPPNAPPPPAPVERLDLPVVRREAAPTLRSTRPPMASVERIE